MNPTWKRNSLIIAISLLLNLAILAYYKNTYLFPLAVMMFQLCLALAIVLIGVLLKVFFKNNTAFKILLLASGINLLIGFALCSMQA